MPARDESALCSARPLRSPEVSCSSSFHRSGARRLGRPIELVARDDKASPDEGRRVSEEPLLKEKVDFTIGFCNTGVALKSVDVFQNNNHLLVVPVSTGSAVTAADPAAQSHVFRMSARDTPQAAVIVDDVLKRGLKNAALFADRTVYGEGGLKDAERFLADKGVKPVHMGRFDIGVKSLVEEARAAKAAGADVLIAYTVGPEQAALWPLSAVLPQRDRQGGRSGRGRDHGADPHSDISNERRGEIQFLCTEDARRAGMIRRKAQ